MMDAICKWSLILSGFLFLSLSFTVIAIECYGDTLLKNWYNDLANLAFYQLISLSICLAGTLLNYAYLIRKDKIQIAENNETIKDLEKVVADIEAGRGWINE